MVILTSPFSCDGLLPQGLRRLPRFQSPRLQRLQLFRDLPGRRKRPEASAPSVGGGWGSPCAAGAELSPRISRCDLAMGQAVNRQFEGVNTQQE